MASSSVTSSSLPTSTSVVSKSIKGGGGSTTAPSLSCFATLSPPSKQVGDGDHAIVYRELQPAWQCTFSQDGRWLSVCYGCPDPCVRLWKNVTLDSNTHRTTTPTASSSPTSKKGAVDHSADWVLSATLSGMHARTIRSIAFAPIFEPATIAAASFDGTISIWEHTSTTVDKQWECIAQLEGHDNEVKCVTWNATGSLLASCGRDKAVWVWESFLPGTVGGGGGGNGGDFDCISVLNAHTADVKCVRFAASHDQWGDGDEIILSASYDETIKIFAEEAGDWFCAATIKGVHHATIWSLAPSPSSTRLISGGADGTMAIYKCYTSAERKERFSDDENSGRGNGCWKCVGTLKDAHQLTIYSVDYASTKCGHGRIASGGADNSINIYKEVAVPNVESPEESDEPQFMVEASAATKHGDVNCVCWHPYDGSILASAGDDGNVQLWKFSSP